MRLVQKTGQAIGIAWSCEYVACGWLGSTWRLRVGLSNPLETEKSTLAEMWCVDEEGYRWTDRGRRPNPMASHDTLLLREIEQDRADQLARRLTLKQMEAIAKDTRLPERSPAPTA